MKKINLLLLLIALILGTYFRFKNIDYDLVFNYDTARDMLVIRDIVINHKLTLIGPTTGIEGIFVGPFYYYSMIIPFILSGGDPLSGAIIIAIFGVAAILMGFLFIKKIFKNSFLAIVGAFLIAFSPLLISYSRFPIHTNYFPLKNYILLVYKSFRTKDFKISYRIIFLWIFVSLAGLLFYKNSVWGWYMIPLYPAFAILPVILCITNEKIFYLIAEPNRTQPDRKEAWLKQYESQGKIISKKEFDPGIIVYKYQR